MKNKFVLILSIILLIGCKKKKEEDTGFSLSDYKFESFRLDHALRTGAVVEMPHNWSVKSIEGTYEEWISYSTFNGISKDSGTQVKVFESSNEIPITRNFCKINNLTPNTEYYVIAYAKYKDEIKYSNQIKFTTLNYSSQFSTNQVGYYPTETIEISPSYLPYISKECTEIINQSLRCYVDGVEVTNGFLFTSYGNVNYTIPCGQLAPGQHKIRVYLDGIMSPDLSITIYSEPSIDFSNSQTEFESYDSGDTIRVMNSPGSGVSFAKTATIGEATTQQLDVVQSPPYKLHFIVPQGIVQGKYALKLHTYCATYLVDSIWINVP